MLHNDIKTAEHSLDNVIENWRDFSSGRRQALTNMMFNLGQDRFSGFKKMIAAIEKNDWDEVHKEALDSKWSKQVGSRAQELADMLRLG